jgi:aryl-alcohol dehydrogenase-like predicted oxidoreductase
LIKRQIGSLEVSVVGIGCNNFGRELSVEQSRSVIHAALDHGINFFDTADQYGKSWTLSEQTMGQAFGARRDEALIATKFGRRHGDEYPGGASPGNVRAATEGALRRLNTDHIDLMQIHIPDPATPIADSLGALAELVEAGKIREIGVSNFTGPQLREAVAAQQAGRARFVSTQEEYSLLHRDIEHDVLPECERLGIALLPYFPLYNGLLTGKYRPGQALPENTRIMNKPDAMRDSILSEQNLKIVGELIEFAESRGHSLLELTFGWLLSHQPISSVIAGATSPQQVASNAAAASWVLTADESRAIDDIAPDPQP